MCQQRDRQENGDNTRQEGFSRSYMQPVSTPVPRSAGSADQPHLQHVETLSIPDDQSTPYDYDHRTTMTIQYQQRQCPQDIWLHSPWQSVLYQPALRFSLPDPQPPQQQASSGDATREARAESAKPVETNGHAAKGASG
ncbi:hypothetical protein ACHAPJ_009890 [Fusarium lateritium]